MEGYLEKKVSFFSGWNRYYYILCEDTLIEFTPDRTKKIGIIHIKISKIKTSSEPCQIIIHTGSCEIILKAQNIKEMVKWCNTLIEAQARLLQEEKDHELEREDLITHLGEKMNEKLATRIFGKFDPIYDKIGQCWSLQAQMEEAFSVLEEEMVQDPALGEKCESLGQVTNSIKELVADILEDLEISRRDFARALVKFSEIEEPMILNNAKITRLEDSSSESELDIFDPVVAHSPVPQ